MVKGWRLLSGIRPPADPKDPPFVLLWDIPFWLAAPKKFLADYQYILILRGENAPKNAIFCSTFSKKCSFLACFFFKNLLAVQETWSKKGLYSILGSSENQFILPKKMVDKIFIFFWKSPLEKTLDPPLARCWQKAKVWVVCFLLSRIIQFWKSLTLISSLEDKKRNRSQYFTDGLSHSEASQ